MASGDIYSSGGCHPIDIEIGLATVFGGSGVDANTLFGFWRDGNVYGSNGAVLNNYNTMTWYNLKMKVNLNSGNVDYWINGNYIGQQSSQTLKNKALNYKYFYMSSGAGKGWVDNVKVYQGEVTPSQAISNVSAIWKDETDEMIVPYDQVKFKLTFKNNLPTTIKNIKLTFNSKVDVPITLESEKNYTNDVLPGGQFDVYNLMNVKGVDNSKIYDDIISTINGKIYLTDSIKVKITYDTDTETGLDGGNMDISPTDTPGGTVLSIQYPDYYTNPYHEDLDEDINYYLEGDDDFSNGECIDRDSDGSCDSTPNVLVRKYAVEAAAYFGTFPDNPKDVSFNVFRYVDDKLGKDKDPAPYANNDIWIVGEFENKRDLSNIGWICIPQAYLFTSFERALGFPSREITVGEGTHKAESEKPKIEYYQNAGAEVWYNGYWNYYDPWTSEENYNVLKFDDLLGINITASACKI
jgi:hypothetical protein